MYLINFKPLPIPNCQFKILRENSLITNRERETHARKLRENNRGGKTQVRRVSGGSIKPQDRPKVHVEQKPIPGKPLPPIIRPMPAVPGAPGQSQAPPAEIERKPNCELKREMSR